MAVNGSWVLKLIKVVATVIVVVVAVGVAMLTVIIPKATGSTSLTVLTGSMSPAIPPGSIVLVKPTDPSTIEAGEVITYQAEPGKAASVTHRVGSSAERRGGKGSGSTCTSRWLACT